VCSKAPVTTSTEPPTSAVSDCEPPLKSLISTLSPCSLK